MAVASGVRKNLKMEQQKDSAMSDTEAEDQVGRQGMIKYYVDGLVRGAVERPYDSAPQLLQHMTLAGPCPSQGDVPHLSGGRIIFCRTCRRMNAIRRAALNGEMNLIPADLRTCTGPGEPKMDPPFQD